MANSLTVQISSLVSANIIVWFSTVFTWKAATWESCETQLNYDAGILVPCINCSSLLSKTIESSLVEAWNAVVDNCYCVLCELRFLRLHWRNFQEMERHQLWLFARVRMRYTPNRCFNYGCDEVLLFVSMLTVRHSY